MQDNNKKYFEPILAQRSEVPLKSKIHNVLWRFVNSWIFPITMRSHLLRCLLLRMFGASVGKRVRLSNRCRIEYPKNIIIGDNSSIGDYCYISGLDQVRIGSNVCISDGVNILTGSHDITSISFALETRPVFLADGVWLATRAIILPGAAIGRGAVVGAGSVVSKQIDDFGIVVGNPANIIGKREIFE